MKSLNFQRNKSLIRIANEQKIKKVRNWDRVMYLVLLALFVLFMGYYAFTKIFYISADGHVIIESNHLRLTDDARILSYKVHESDSVDLNDTLFSYALDLDNENYGGASVTASGAANTDTWQTKEAFSLRKNLALNNIEINENKQLIIEYQNEIKRLSNEAILDIIPKSRLEYVQNEILKLSTANKKLQQENKQLSYLLNVLKSTNLPNQYNQVKSSVGASLASGINKNNFSNEDLSEEKFFLAPMKGIVTRISIHATETALKADEIMTLHKAEPAYIKAFFEQEDLQHFGVGDIMNIEFADGTKTKGVLKRFYIATFALPDEFQKKYEPVTRTIAADIFPADSTELHKWKAFHKIGVRISKFKY